MVHGLASGDPARDRWMMLGQMVAEMVLGDSGTQDQDLLGGGELSGQLLMELPLLFLVTDAIQPMSVVVGVARSERFAFHRLARETEKLGLVVIDPYDGE
jgi:hypothetical protein